MKIRGFFILFGQDQDKMLEKFLDELRSDSPALFKELEEAASPVELGGNTTNEALRKLQSVTVAEYLAFRQKTILQTNWPKGSLENCSFFSRPVSAGLHYFSESESMSPHCTFNDMDWSSMSKNDTATNKNDDKDDDESVQDPMDGGPVPFCRHFRAVLTDAGNCFSFNLGDLASTYESEIDFPDFDPEANGELRAKEHLKQNGFRFFLVIKAGFIIVASWCCRYQTKEKIQCPCI